MASAVVSPTPPRQACPAGNAEMLANTLVLPAGETSTSVVPVPCTLALSLKLLTRMSPAVSRPPEAGMTATPYGFTSPLAGTVEATWVRPCSWPGNATGQRPGEPWASRPGQPDSPNLRWMPMNRPWPSGPGRSWQSGFRHSDQASSCSVSKGHAFNFGRHFRAGHASSARPRVPARYTGGLPIRFTSYATCQARAAAAPITLI
jgi:hypothetical protein